MNVDKSLLPPEARTFELVRRFGWTIEQCDEAPAERVDWLLQMARTYDDVLEEQEPRR